MHLQFKQLTRSIHLQFIQFNQKFTIFTRYTNMWTCELWMPDWLITPSPLVIKCIILVFNRCYYIMPVFSFHNLFTTFRSSFTMKWLCNESSNFLDVVLSKCIVPILFTRACGCVIDSNETLFVLVDNFLLISMINQLFPQDDSLRLLLSNILLKSIFLHRR